MSESEDDEFDENDTDASDYTCTVCSKEFSSVMSYQTHRSEQLSCTHCDKRFCDEKQLGDHSLACSLKLNCGVCQAIFYDPTALKEHIALCSALTCDVCHMKFTSFVYLKTHRTLKHKFCEYCKGSFSDEGFAKHKFTKHYFKCGKCSCPFTTSVSFLELKGIPKLCVACLLESKSSQIQIDNNASFANSCNSKTIAACEKNIPPDHATANVGYSQQSNAKGESTKTKFPASSELCYTVEAFQLASKTGQCPYCSKKISNNMECHMKICVQVCNYICKMRSIKGKKKCIVAKEVISDIQIDNNSSFANSCNSKTIAACEKNIPPDHATANVGYSQQSNAKGKSPKTKSPSSSELCYTVEAFQLASKTGQCPYCSKKISNNMECHMKICVQVCNYICKMRSIKGKKKCIVAKEVVSDTENGNNQARNASISVAKLDKQASEEGNLFLFEEVISDSEEDGIHTVGSKPETNNSRKANVVTDTADNDAIAIDGVDDNNEGSSQNRKKSYICHETGNHKVGDKPEKNNSVSVPEVDDTAGRVEIAADVGVGEFDDDHDSINSIDSNHVSLISNISVVSGTCKIDGKLERNNSISVYDINAADSDVIIVDDDSDCEIDKSKSSNGNKDSQQVIDKSDICVTTGIHKLGDKPESTNLVKVYEWNDLDTRDRITVDEVDHVGVDDNQFTINTDNSIEVRKNSDVCVAVSIHTAVNKVQRNNVVSVYQVNNDPVSIDMANSDSMGCSSTVIVEAGSDVAVGANAVCVEEKKKPVWSNALERYGEIVDKIFNTIWMRPNWNCNNCQICKAPVKNLRMYKLHMKSAHGMTLLFEKTQASRFRCNECQWGWDSLEDVNLHIYKQHETIVPCDKCSHVSNSYKESKLHLHSVHPDSINKCDQCDSKFTDSKQLKLHLNQHYTHDIYDCNVCGKKIRGKFKLTTHKWHHNRKHRRFLCPVCGKISNSSENLLKHVRSVHLHIKPKTVLCPDCGLLFKIRSYKRHWERVHSGVLNTCTVCSKDFPTRQGLKQHMLTHVEERNYRCDCCPAAYKQLKNLRHHKSKVHSATAPPRRIREPKIRSPPLKDGPPAEKKPIQPVECPVCSQKFPPSRLRRHLTTHGLYDATHFSCTKCDESFSSAGSLRNHVKWIHLGERKFSCSYCSAKFKRRDALVMHVRRHTGEKPYSCGLCDRRFRQPTDCKKHEAKHAQPYYRCDRPEQIQSSTAGSAEEFDKNSASSESDYVFSEEDRQAVAVLSCEHKDYT